MHKLLARQLPQASRRQFLTARRLTLGGLGCSAALQHRRDNATAEAALMRISRFNDRVQGWLFDPSRLAPTYLDSMITRPFRSMQPSMARGEVPQVDGDGFSWRSPTPRGRQAPLAAA